MLYAGNNASEEGTEKNLDVMKIEFQFVGGFFHAIMFGNVIGLFPSVNEF